MLTYHPRKYPHKRIPRVCRPLELTGFKLLLAGPCLASIPQYPHSSPPCFGLPWSLLSRRGGLETRGAFVGGSRSIPFQSGCCNQLPSRLWHNDFPSCPVVPFLSFFWGTVPKDALLSPGHWASEFLHQPVFCS